METNAKQMRIMKFTSIGVLLLQFHETHQAEMMQIVMLFAMREFSNHYAK